MSTLIINPNGTAVMCQGDTDPPLVFQLVDRDGPIDLTGCDVLLTLVTHGRDSTTAVDHAACVVTDAATGTGQYNWATGDTDAPGYYDGQLKVVSQEDPTQFWHFPNRQPFSLEVTPAL